VEVVTANMPGISGKNVKRSKAALANTPLTLCMKGFTIQLITNE
jgi:hypothetical protein